MTSAHGLNGVAVLNYGYGIHSWDLKYTRFEGGPMVCSYFLFSVHEIFSLILVLHFK